MKIDYKITEYFDKNNLFDDGDSAGLNIKITNNTLVIKGNARDLVALSDILVSLASEKEKSSHIHIDNLTILDINSDFEEIVIEKL